MSSPLDRDFGPDEPSPYAPKWVRNAADARRDRTGERQGAEAAEHPTTGARASIAKPPEDLASEKPPVARMPKGPVDLDSEDVRRPGAGPAAGNEPVVVERYRLPPSLEPTLMPDWPVPRTRSALGLLMRLAVAAGVAAVIALFVVGKFPGSLLVAGNSEKPDSPSFGSRFSGRNANPAEQTKSAAAQLIPSQESPRVSGASGPLGGTPLGGTLTRTVTTEAATAPAGAAQPPAIAAVQPPAVAAAQPSAGPARTFPIRQLDRDEIADLMRRGEDFIAAGDLASARLVLQRAAEAGDPRAALTLAGTYDPIVLEKLDIQGFGSDIAAARTWYERAKEFGSAEAPRRLEMLASRAH